MKSALNLDLTLSDDGECLALLISCGIIDLGASCVKLWSFFVKVAWRFSSVEGRLSRVPPRPFISSSGVFWSFGIFSGVSWRLTRLPAGFPEFRGGFPETTKGFLEFCHPRGFLELPSDFGNLQSQEIKDISGKRRKASRNPQKSHV